MLLYVRTSLGRGPFPTPRILRSRNNRSLSDPPEFAILLHENCATWNDGSAQPAFEVGAGRDCSRPAYVVRAVLFLFVSRHGRRLEMRLTCSRGANGCR